jgi:hypothetical protein
MKLTGKCKEGFEEWMLINNKELVKYSEERYSEVIDMSQLFKYLTDSMQYGVLVDFYDSVGVFIQIETRIFDKEHPCYIYSETVYNRVGLFKTRHEARIAAIEKANEIYNYEKTKE